MDPLAKGINHGPFTQLGSWLTGPSGPTTEHSYAIRPNRPNMPTRLPPTTKVTQENVQRTRNMLAERDARILQGQRVNEASTNATGVHIGRSQLHNLVANAMTSGTTSFITQFVNDNQTQMPTLANEVSGGGKVPLELVFASKQGFFGPTCNNNLAGNEIITLLWPYTNDKAKIRKLAEKCPGFTLPANGGYRRRKTKSRKSRKTKRHRKTRSLQRAKSQRGGGLFGWSNNDGVIRLLTKNPTVDITQLCKDTNEELKDLYRSLVMHQETVAFNNNLKEIIRLEKTVDYQTSLEQFATVRQINHIVKESIEKVREVFARAQLGSQRTFIMDQFRDNIKKAISET